ncbi:TPA: phage tail sheath subtilisin-like domain-containing protein, partial [Escherichia coli]|nr:phage tail sheath subtilisin-like domain-containing protein [Escherichia coli]
MSVTNFLHGIRTLEYDDGTKEINTVDISVIGIVGTAPDSSYPTCASLLWGSELADNLVEFSTVMPGADGNNWIVEIVDLGINGNVATPGYSTLPDGSRKLTMITDGAMTPSKMYDQNQQYKEGLQIGEYINVTFGGDHAGTGTVFALPPTNLSGGKDESFKYNVPTLIAGSQKKAGLLGGSGTLPPAVSEILNQEDAIIVVVRVEEDSDETKMRQNVVNGINALLTSAQINQVTPRILIAPDYSANDYIAEQLEVVTNKLRGVGYIDSPRGATPADVVNRRQRYGGRMEILRPRVYSTSDVSGLSRPYSAIAAGLRARIDNEKGFWWSKSNQNIYGITGLEQVD